jgi:hypothetical protein
MEIKSPTTIFAVNYAIIRTIFRTNCYRFPPEIQIFVPISYINPVSYYNFIAIRRIVNCRLNSIIIRRYMQCSCFCCRYYIKKLKLCTPKGGRFLDLSTSTRLSHLTPVPSPLCGEGCRGEALQHSGS